MQVVKPDAKKWGVLQFGTEVVASKDKTIVGLLGAYMYIYMGYI